MCELLNVLKVVVIKKRCPVKSSVFNILSGKNLFLSFFHVLFVTVHEFIYATGSIH